MMSNSSDPASAPMKHEEQRGQERDSDDGNDFTVFKRHKRKIAEAAAKLQQIFSDSEEDNDVRLVQKRQKLQDEEEDSRKSEAKFGSLTSEKELYSALSNDHKKNKNIVAEKEEEHSGFEDCNIDSNGDDKQENVTKPSRAKYVPKRKKPHDDICSSSDSDCKQQRKKIQFVDDYSVIMKNKADTQVSFNFSACDDVKNKSPSKQEASRKCGNVSENENSVETSPSKQSVRMQDKRSTKSHKKSKPKEQLSNSEAEDENSSNTSKCALESDQDSKPTFNENKSLKEQNKLNNSTGSTEKERNKKMESLKKEPSDSDSEKNELQTTTEALLHEGSLNNSESEVRKKQQEVVTLGENRKGKNSDSDSDEEKPLKMVFNKTAKQRDSSSDSDREDNEEKQENTMRKVKGGREIASDPASEEEPLKIILKKPAKQGDISNDSGKIGNITKQQKLKTKVDARRKKESDSESDSEDEKPLKSVSKETTEQGASSCDSDRGDSKIKQQKAKSKVKAGRRNNSDSESDCEEEKPLKTVSKKTTEQGSNSCDPGREYHKMKQQKAKTKLEARRRNNSDSESDSEDEKPLNSISKKTTKKGASLCDSDREDSKRKQQKAKTKVEARRRNNSDSESDSEDEKPSKSISKKTTKKGASLCDSGREDCKRRQQKAKTKVEARTRKDSDSESDSEEEKLLKTVSKKTTEQRGSLHASGREDSKRKQQKAESKMKARRRKNSVTESDSEEEKSLKTVSIKALRQRGGANNTNREGNRKKQNKAMTKVNSRKGRDSDSDSEEEKSTEDSVDEELRKLTRGSESNLNNTELSKSKPKSQKQETTYSSDSDDEPLKTSEKEKTQIKQSKKREQGKKTSRNNSDSDMQNEKPSRNSREDTHTNSDSSDIIVESARKNKPPVTTEETGLVSSNSSAESDISAENTKSQTPGKKERHGSVSDMDLDLLTKKNSAPSVRVANALKGIKAKHSTEDSTDSSDYDEDKSKKRSETKKSLHTMSSSESEDSSAGTKTKKREAIKKASNKKKGNKSSDSTSDSSVSGDERPKDKKKGKKDVPENKRITSLKRYLRLAGIHNVQYFKVLQNCRSNKAKIEALLNLLRKEGLKGNPTIQKCKRLRKKIETRREVQELDVGNIMEEKGRPHRSCRCSYTENYNEGYKHDAEEKAALIRQKFSRIRDIIDSDSD